MASGNQNKALCNVKIIILFEDFCRKQLKLKRPLLKILTRLFAYSRPALSIHIILHKNRLACVARNKALLSVKLHLLCSRLYSAGLNLAYEKYLLLHQPKNPQDMYLFFYENLPAIILGTSLRLEREVYLHKKHPPVFRRMSGGGSVCHFRGNLNYALIANLQQWPQIFPVPDSYRVIIGALTTAMGSNVAMQGLSDISVWQRGVWRKISGNSQARKRGWLLHHGTFLYNLTSARQISYYLQPPEKQPAYRKNRSHRAFIATSLPCRSRTVLMRNISHSLVKTFGLQLAYSPLTAQQQLTELRSVGLSAVLSERISL